MSSLVAEFAPLVSQMLGYLIVVGSVILKVPQIIKILKNHSAEGVSLKGHLMELVVYNIAASWGYAQELPFSAYGENVLVLVQLIVLGVIIGIYQKKLASAMMMTVVLCAAGAGLALQLAPPEVHPLLLKSNAVLGAVARLPQIYENYRRRSTGQLAFLTFFLAFGGAGARLATTSVSVPWEKGKATMMGTYGLSTLLNGIIVFQILYYGSKVVRKLSPAPADGSKAPADAPAAAAAAPPMARKASGLKKRATKKED